MPKFSEILNELLERFTQEQLAKKLGTSVKSIQNWISGENKPRREAIMAIEALYEKEKGGFHVKDAAGAILEKLIRIEATLNVLFSDHVKQSAAALKQDALTIYRAKIKEVETEADRLFDEQGQK